MTNDDKRDTIRNLISFLYGQEKADSTYQRLSHLLEQFRTETTRSFDREKSLFDEAEVILITYGDLLKKDREKPLKTLFNFYQKYLQDTISTLHILPFFPYSSDDGFSVIDYHAVDPHLGDWQDIYRFQQNDVRTMFDAVINHVSASSKWFKSYLYGDPEYKEYFISMDPRTDLSQVTRPRETSLLTGFATSNGIQYIWTTFSNDQVDLNFKNPDTLLDIIDVLLDYIEHGADIIRLDAIAYIWKEVGTTCIHLPQAHAVVQLFRAIVDEVAPGVLLISETNVPHQENISYFGNGENEAHMVYQFSLPPLTAHAILTGSATYLSQWAKGLKTPSQATAFFNFTASHDGVGVRPAAGILPSEELDVLIQTTQKHGGFISSKTNTDGTSSPYELNITYFDLLNDPNNKEEQEMQVNRFLVSQAIMLAMAGIPGVYMHSLLGSRNDIEGVHETGRARSINREKLFVDEVEDQLEEEDSLRSAVFKGYQQLLKQRISQKAFHPNAEQRVLEHHPAIFTLLRRNMAAGEVVLALHNVSDESVSLGLDLLAEGLPTEHGWTDLLSDENYPPGKQLRLAMNPYQVRWLKLEN